MKSTIRKWSSPPKDIIRVKQYYQMKEANYPTYEVMYVPEKEENDEITYLRPLGISSGHCSTILRERQEASLIKRLERTQPTLEVIKHDARTFRGTFRKKKFNIINSDYHWQPTNNLIDWMQFGFLHWMQNDALFYMNYYAGRDHREAQLNCKLALQFMKENPEFEEFLLPIPEDEPWPERNLSYQSFTIKTAVEVGVKPEIILADSYPSSNGGPGRMYIVGAHMTRF